MKRQVKKVETDSEAAWLSEREMQAWLGLLAIVSALPAALETQLQRDAGLSLFEYLVLAMLSEQPEYTAQLKVLAELAGGSLSRLSHVLNRLERAGSVHREPSVDDGRVTLARLTEPGSAVVVAAAPLHAAAVRELVFDRLTARQVDQLATITARLGPPREAGPTP